MPLAISKLLKCLPVPAMLMLACCGACVAREGDRPVIQPAPLVLVAPPPDVVPEFGQIYRAAGSPRLILLWNRTLSDQSQLGTAQKRVVRDSGTADSNRSERSTPTVGGSLSMGEESARFDRTTTETRSTVALAEPTRRIAMEERYAVMVERAFVMEMNRAGVRFVDRALAMRATAAERHRGGADQQLIETDALYGFGDLVMEVVWIEDADAPSRYAFDVRTKSLKTGQEVSSVFSRGIGPRPAQQPGAWVAGKDGYEFAQPAAPAPGPVDIGMALAHDVMNTLATALTTMKPAPPARPRR